MREENLVLRTPVCDALGITHPICQAGDVVRDIAAEAESVIARLVYFL